MMHDLTLNRTSTGLGPVRNQNWHGYIDGITTKAEPAQPIPRFNDVLDFLIRPEISEGRKGLYMIVDIKASHLLSAPSFVIHSHIFNHSLIIPLKF